MKVFAKTISILFHPLIMPIYAMFVVLYFSPMGMFFAEKGRAYLLLLTAISTFFLPFLFVVLLRNIGVVSSLSLREQKERVAPLLFGASMCYVNYLFLLRIPRLPAVFPQLFSALAIFLIFLAIITKFWKISLHLAAIGGLLAITFAFSVQSWLFLTVIFCAGLVGTSRLLLKAHNSWQVYVGFFFGLFYLSGYFLF